MHGHSFRYSVHPRILNPSTSLFFRMPEPLRILHFPKSSFRCPLLWLHELYWETHSLFKADSAIDFLPPCLLHMCLALCLSGCALWRPEYNLWYCLFSSAIHLAIWDMVSLWLGSHLIQVAWLSSKPWRTDCLHLPSTGVTSVLPHPALLCRFMGSSQVLMLVWQVSYGLSYPHTSDPPYLCVVDI